jgi:hypothetical protein
MIDARIDAGLGVRVFILTVCHKMIAKPGQRVPVLEKFAMGARS